MNEDHPAAAEHPEGPPPAAVGSPRRAAPGAGAGLSRRGLLYRGALSGAAVALSPAVALAAAAAARRRDRGPRLDLAQVEAFVRAGHTDLDRTRQLLDEEPALVNAAWDWGGGDWETALGGASHMGRPDIARLLLRRGARMDVFCAAMLGEAALVASFLDFDPRVVALAGPHGIPLLRHAEAGGSREVWDLLVARGAEAPPRGG